MPTLDTKIHLDLLADYNNPGDLATSQNLLKFARQINMATGVAASQADKLWHDERTLTASATEDLDLAGSLLDPVTGVAMTFVKVKGLIVSANAANTNDVVVGAASATQFVGPFGAATHTIKVPPGGLLVSLGPGLAGIGSVAAGSTDLLKIANSAGGTSVIYQIVIIGTSA